MVLIDPKELQETIMQLEQAFYNHQRWLKGIARMIICNLPSGKERNKGAHKKCQFGQWYYCNSPDKLRQNAKFIALGDDHYFMHEKAKHLLSIKETGGIIDIAEYESFIQALKKFRLNISEIQNELNELFYNRDSLTGANNRINMLPILRAQQNLLKEMGTPGCIVMLDIDHFKRVNDQYGHGAGDYVLAWLAYFIMEKLNSNDQIFRVGGEEFLVSLHNTELPMAFEKIDQLRCAIASTKINLDDDLTISITVSFGICELRKNISVEKTIKYADEALYQAKAEGRNCVRTYKKV